jgi:hypothetical protein
MDYFSGFHDELQGEERSSNDRSLQLLKQLTKTTARCYCSLIEIEASSE